MNTKHVQISYQVPRDPEAYQATTHFGQRAKGRVPPEHRDKIIRECITKGKIRGTTPTQACQEDGVKQYFCFERAIEGSDWRVVVGIRPKAFKEDDIKHYAVTIVDVE